MLITEEIHQFWVRNYSSKSQNKIPEHTNKTELVPVKNKLKIKRPEDLFSAGMNVPRSSLLLGIPPTLRITKAIKVNSGRSGTNSALLWGWGRISQFKISTKKVWLNEQFNFFPLLKHLNHSFLSCSRLKHKYHRRVWISRAKELQKVQQCWEIKKTNLKKLN